MKIDNKRSLGLISLLILIPVAISFAFLYQGMDRIPEETDMVPELKNHDPSSGKNPSSADRPDFCGIWGIWGGERVSAENRPWFKGVVTTIGWKDIEPENGVLDERFFINQTAPHSLSIRVVYFDKGTGTWSFIYDAMNHPEKTAQTITNTNTGEWREAVFELKDARLSNRGAKKSDFGIVHMRGDEAIFQIMKLF